MPKSPGVWAHGTWCVGPNDVTLSLLLPPVVTTPFGHARVCHHPVLRGAATTVREAEFTMSHPRTPTDHESHHQHVSQEQTLRSNTRQNWAGRAQAAASGLVGTIAGIVPHVLHHVAPIAGAAFLTGTTGSIMFGLAGFVLTVPMLLRLRRRFRTWLAPAIALVLFILAFTFSTVVIGPAISGGDDGEPQVEEDLDPHGH